MHVSFFLMLLLWFVRGILGNRVWNFLMILRFNITCILWTKINHPRSVLFCIIWVGQVLLPVNFSILFFVFILKVLRPEKSQVTIVGILPNKRSQLARYCLVWVIRPIYGPTTIGQVTIKACFTGFGPVHRLSVFFVFILYMICKCLIKCNR